MMNMKMGRDLNGNKIVTVSFPGKGIKGFSIQTNGNLPETHDTNTPVIKEIVDHVTKFGTKRQKQIVFEV